MNIAGRSFLSFVKQGYCPANIVKTLPKVANLLEPLSVQNLEGFTIHINDSVALEFGH
jgi:hypothetical protein